MTRRSFVARVPDEPGSLHRAAELIKRQRGNIERIQYDRRIDPNTVFFEVSMGDEDFEAAMRGLDEMGYLRQTLEEPALLRFKVQLPHEHGALFQFLDGISDAHANISSLDFDATDGIPDSLEVGLVLDDHRRAEGLIDSIKARYPLQVLEHRRSGEGLDDAVFYLRFAQELRSLIPDVEDEFLLQFLSNANHIAQSLHRLGRDPRQAFESLLDSGRLILESVGPNFFCDIQTLEVEEGVIHALQMPCGGNVYLLEGEEGCLMLDSGYGHYHADLLQLLSYLGFRPDDFHALLITHADSDHAGSAGRFPFPSHLSEGALTVIETGDRAHGSIRAGTVLESYYTRLINLLSGFCPPRRTVLFPSAPCGRRGDFDVLQRETMAGWDVEVLAGLGGHAPGEVFYHLPRSNVVFSSDSFLDFDGLSEERKEYMSLAKLLMTTVNVDSEKAREERGALRALVIENNALVCAGHGPAFRLRSGVAESVEPIVSYRHGGGISPQGR